MIKILNIKDPDIGQIQLKCIYCLKKTFQSRENIHRRKNKMKGCFKKILWPQVNSLNSKYLLVKFQITLRPQ